MRTSFLTEPEAQRISQMFSNGTTDLSDVEFCKWLDQIIFSSIKAYDEKTDVPEHQSGLDFLGNMHRFLTSTELGRNYCENRKDQLPSLLVPIWERLLGEKRPENALYHSDFARYYLSFLESPFANKHGSQNFRKEFSQFATEDRTNRILTLAEKHGFDHKYSKNQLEAIRISQHLLGTSDKDPLLGLPLLSDDALASQLGLLQQKAELDARDFRLYQDAQIQAQMEINRLMRESNDWAHRTVAFKLRDKILNGFTDFGNPISYPSESLFSESLAVMDSNGRAVDTLLHFRRGILGPKIEFPRADVDDKVYMMAALQARSRGISRPHINTTFKSPRLAILFMEKSVDALVKSGYNIDDITVAPHLQDAFNNYKLTMSERFEITEGEEPDTLTPPQNKKTQPDIPNLPEEQIANENKKINEDIRVVHDAISNEEKPLKFSDLPHEDVCNVVSALVNNQGRGLTWQEMQHSSGLSKISESTALWIKDEVEKIYNRFDPQSAQFDPEKGANNYKQLELLTKIGVAQLIVLYGQEKFGRCLEHLNAAQMKNNERIQAQSPVPPLDVSNSSGDYSYPKNTNDFEGSPSLSSLNMANSPNSLPVDDYIPVDGPPPAPPLDDPMYSVIPDADPSGAHASYIPPHLELDEQHRDDYASSIQDPLEELVNEPEQAQEISAVNNDNYLEEFFSGKPNFDNQGSDISLSEAELQIKNSAMSNSSLHQLESQPLLMDSIKKFAMDTNSKSWLDFSEGDIRFALNLSDDILYELKTGPERSSELIKLSEKCAQVKDLISAFSEPLDWSQHEIQLLKKFPKDVLPEKISAGLSERTKEMEISPVESIPEDELTSPKRR